MGARRFSDELILSVRDNGPGPSPEKTTSGVGLRNTIARLQQLYGDAQHFALRPAEGGGTIAEVRIPYHVREAAA